MEDILRKKMFLEKKVLLALIVVALLAFASGAAAISTVMMQVEMNMSVEEKTADHISLMENIQEEMRHDHKYRCCLEKPCASCVSLSPWHGEGAECNCLEDLVNGEAPCGECVGGILAGRGNMHLKEYFVDSILEELGEQYRPQIEEIIEEKYKLTAEAE